MRALAVVLLLLVASASACGGEDAEGEGAERGGQEASRYTVDLRPLNTSGVDGKATMRLTGNRLVVHIDATGLEPNRIHEQYIHGFRGDQRATCPKPSERTLRLEGAERSFGPSLRALEPFPTLGSKGRLDYDLGFRVGEDDVLPLDGRALVLRGKQADLGGEDGEQYHPDLPVACGVIDRVVD